MDSLIEIFITILRGLFNSIKYILVDTIFDILFNKYNSKNGIVYNYKVWFVFLIILGLIYLLLKIN